MTNILIDFYNNKLLFYGLIIVIAIIIVLIILIKKSGNKNDDEKKVDYQKVDGNESLFDKIMKQTENNNHQDNKLDLESMIEKMQKDLDAKASEVVEKFENEQEEKSIISYKELIKNDKIEKIQEEAIEEKNNKDAFLNDIIDDFDDERFPNLNKDNLKETYISALEFEEDNSLDNKEIADEINETVISNLNKKDEFVNAIKNGDFDEKNLKAKNINNSDSIFVDDDYNKTPIESKVEKNLLGNASVDNYKENLINDVIDKEINIKKDNNHSQNKFKSTEFISPIYGIQDIKIQYPTVQNMKEYRNQARNYNKFELEQTLNIEPLSDEVRKDEDFLKALKEFRKNLE